MHTRIFKELDLKTLLERALTGDRYARTLIAQHFKNKPPASSATYIQEALVSEVAKSDDACNPRALGLLAIATSNEVEARALIARGMRLDDPGSYHLRAMTHHTKGNLETAISLYEKAIELGSIKSNTNLAVIYMDTDNDKAIELLEKAMQHGNMHAMHNRGYLYFHSGEHDKAYNLFIQSADLGCIDAINVLGKISQLDLCDQQRDYQKAIGYYEQAVALGSPEAMIELGNMHRKGEGCSHDYTQAAQLYRQAYLHGDTDTRISATNQASSLYMDAYMRYRTTHSSNDSKRQYIQITYHKLMMTKQPDVLPKEVIKLFQQHPSEVSALLLSDDLLTETEQQHAANFVGQHYYDLATKTIDDADIQSNKHFNMAITSLSKVPSTATCYTDALALKTDCLYILAETTSQLSDIPRHLLSLNQASRELLTQGLGKLDKDSQPKLTRALQEAILTCPNYTATPSETYQHQALPTLPAEQHLQLHTARRKQTHNYAALLRMFLSTAHAALTHVSNQPSRLPRMWQRTLSAPLQQAKSLLDSKGIPKKTKNILLLSNAVITLLKQDRSKLSRELLSALPSMPCKHPSLSESQRLTTAAT